MSIRLIRHLATNLHGLRQAAFTDETGKQRPALGEAGLTVLLLLCNGANDNTLKVFWSVTAIEENTGLHGRTIKRALAGFEQLGWIERVGEIPQEGRGGMPTVIYRVMLEHYGDPDDAPKTSDDDDNNAPKTTRNMRKSAPIVPSGAPIEPAKSKRGKGSKGNAKTETRNPKPETRNPQPSATDPGPGGGGLVAHRFEAAVDMAVAMEATRYLERNPDNPPGPAMREGWRVKLIRQMERVLELMDDPNCADADIETVARQAHNNYLAAKDYLHHPGRPGIDSPALRRPAMGSAPAWPGLPGCPECGGTGTLEGEPTRTGPGVSLPCPCRARAAG